MNRVVRLLLVASLVACSGALVGCSGEPKVYGSIGVSSGYSSYHGRSSGPRVRGSVSIGGRIR